MKVVTDSVCEEKNFEAIYSLQSEPLFRFMYYKFADRDKAADHVQESFVKLWNNCAKVSYEKAKSYLFTVANNSFLNEMAHLKVKQNFLQLNHKHYTNQDPEFLLEEKDFAKKLEKAIEGLNEKQRTVFLLHRIEQKKYSEIAEILDLSIKAVEKRMGQALKELRKSIKI